MTDWILLAAPLVVASLVLVLGFVGCFLDSIGEHQPDAPEITYTDKVAAHPNLVGYWRLGEASGTTAVDSKGGNDGTYVGGVMLGSPGLVEDDPDTAALFAGVGQYVAVPRTDALNPPTFTVEALVSVAEADDYRAVVSSRHVDPTSQNTFGYTLYVSDAGDWEAWVGDGDVTWETALGPPATDAVQFAAMTYDGTTLKLYVDPETDAPAEVAAAYQPNPQNELRIGAGANEAATPLYFFQGVIDEVAIYDVALDFDTILDHFTLATVSREEALD